MCGGHKMYVGDTKYLWEKQTHVICYTLHVHVTSVCACAGFRAQRGASFSLTFEGCVYQHLGFHPKSVSQAWGGLGVHLH